MCILKFLVMHNLMMLRVPVSLFSILSSNGPRPPQHAGMREVKTILTPCCEAVPSIGRYRSFACYLLCPKFWSSGMLPVLRSFGHCPCVSLLAFLFLALTTSVSLGSGQVSSRCHGGSAHHAIQGSFSSIHSTPCAIPWLALSASNWRSFLAFWSFWFTKGRCMVEKQF